MAGHERQSISSQERVAIVGTGFAGLTTAYLLHNDAQKRYAVTLLEQGDSLSFDSASVAVKNDRTGTVERIDLPMRASAGGYYVNLHRMYRHLGVPVHPVRFLFVFAKALRQNHADALKPQSSPTATASAVPGGYFVHPSNHHQIPPPWPSSYGVFRYLLEVLYLILCHFWFRAACFLIHPIKSIDGDSRKAESFANYLDRIWLPRRYVSHYVLPLMSSVSTCTHAELLAFPASDVVNYIKLSYNHHHYTVCGGVRQVQARLSAGIEDIRLRSRVLQVVPLPETRRTVLVRWQATNITTGRVEVREEAFDRVVLAVPPDVAGRLFKPVEAALQRVPTRWVESSVLAPHTSDKEPSSYSIIDESEGAVTGAAACMHHHTSAGAAAAAAAPAQVIAFRTQFSSTFAGSEKPQTEALHVMPSGVVVRTCPLELDDEGGGSKRTATLKAAGFTRTLRTVESRAAVEVIMGRETGKEATGRSGWVNGEDNVWLTGAWCWDGMVLLEGCVVSAMRVAEDFGVAVPWRDG
ncbi:hypothetical protein VTK56DRAFT_848 [Thermocarpiscus australiensis]